MKSKFLFYCANWKNIKDHNSLTSRVGGKRQIMGLWVIDVSFYCFLLTIFTNTKVLQFLQFLPTTCSLIVNCF